MAPGTAEIFIPIVLFIVTGCVIIAYLMIQLHRRRIESQEILAALEKGMEITLPDKKRNYLLPGLIWTLLGIVITIGMAVSIPPDAPRAAWVWGLIPVAIGAAFLIMHYLEQKKQTE